jgi:hypothetical protein
MAMRKFLCSLIIPLILCAAAWSQSAITRANIKLSTEVRCEAPAVGKSYEWRVFGPDGRVSNVLLRENGRVCSFVPEANTLYNIVSVVEGADGKVYMSDATYKIGNVPTPGPDDPDPVPDDPDDPDDPDPVPTVPDGQFGFIKYTYEAAVKLPKADRLRMLQVKMPDGNITTMAAITAVGVNYYDTSKQLKDGDITDPQAAINKTKDYNHRLLADNPGKWPDVFAAVGKRASDMYVAGTIKNLDDWAIVYEEIYQGLTHAEKESN